MISRYIYIMCRCWSQRKRSLIMKDIRDALAEAARDHVILTFGFATATAQLLLRLLLARLPPGPWRTEPGFTAHQIVCFPMMVLLTVWGFSHWFHEDPAFDSPNARVLNVHENGLFMAKIVFAMQLFWDIPTGLLVPSLREPVMIAHHVGMMSMALMNLAGLWSFYANFFYGVIEISGIILSFIDVFHPKHTAWVDWLRSFPRLSAFNDAMRALFFILYMSVRAVYFPWVVSRILSDFMAMATMPLAARGGLSLSSLAFCPIVGLAFAFLQLYWARLLTKQVVKMLAPPPSEKQKKRR